MDRMGERIGAFQKIFRTVPPHQFVSIEKMRPKYCGSVERSCNSKLIVVCTRPPKNERKENFLVIIDFYGGLSIIVNKSQ